MSSSIIPVNNSSHSTVSERRMLLDRKASDRPLDYFGWMLRANKRYGKSVSAMIKEIYRASRKRQLLTPKEYFFYQLFDDKRYSPAAKATFIGGRAATALARDLHSPWPQIAGEKPTLTALLRGHDLPIPTTQAVRHDVLSFPGAVSLRSSADVAQFLRESAQFPLFSKPTSCARSVGVADLEGYDAKTDSLVLRNGKQIAVNDYVQEVEHYAAQGYLFQSRLVPHADIAKVVGNRIGTVRMVVLSDERGATLLRASWKIPVGDNVADNFWRPGNLLGGIDVETGKMLRVVAQGRNGFEPVGQHPDSGIVFNEYVFPEWDRMREVVLAGARAVASCFLQGWDVALTENGPILVELEGDGGDPVMSQACFDTGLLATPFGEFFEKAQTKIKEGKSSQRAHRRKLLLREAQQVRQGVRSMSMQRRAAAQR